MHKRSSLLAPRGQQRALPAAVHRKGKRPTLLLLLALLCATCGSQVALAGDQFEDAALAAHNQKRQAYNTAALQWDPALAAFAKEVAGRCRWQHTQGSPYGENLFMIAGARPSPNDLAWESVRRWSDEAGQWSKVRGRSDIDYKTVGHFTQLVWKETKKVGCAYVDCSKGVSGLSQGGLLVVCTYDPRGNWIGRFAENVNA